MGINIENIIAAFESLDQASLNQDPFSFNGKFIFLHQGKIFKILASHDAVGELMILEKAHEAGLLFFAPVQVIHKGLIAIYTQELLKQTPINNFYTIPRESLNYWCKGATKEEETISGIVFDQYGNEHWEKLISFTKQFCLGNIYWRNIGFDNRDQIKCFDFQCGLPKNKTGEYYV